MNTPTYPHHAQQYHSQQGSARGRNVDSTLSAIFSSSFDGAEMENNPKAKLYELFILIEKEFEALYSENCALRSRLANESSEKLPTESLASYSENTPTAFASGANVAGSVGADSDYKIYGKKVGRQKWKTAFRGPSGRLVTSLKVAGGNLDANKHRYVQHFRGHTDGIWHLTSATIGACQLLASASADHTAKIWLADEARCVASYVGHGGSVNSVAIRGGGGATADHASAIAAAAAASDQLMALTTSGDRQAHIWRANINQFTQIGNCGFQADETESGDTISTNAINDYRDEDQQSQQFATASTVAASQIAAAGDSVKCGGSGAIQVIQQPVMRLTGHNDVVVSGEWMFGGDHIITASWDRTANVYDVETGKVVNTLSGHDQELTHCSAHGSQKLVATASKDFTFRLWDFREPIQSVAVFQGHNDAVTSVMFTSTHHIASGSDDRTSKVWDLRNMRSPMSTIRLNSGVNTMAVCDKFNLLAIPQDGRHVSVYDVHGMRLARLPRTSGKCHHRMVCCAAWLTENSTNNLFTCGFDKQIIGWKFQLPTANKN